MIHVKEQHEEFTPLQKLLQTAMDEVDCSHSLSLEELLYMQA